MPDYKCPIPGCDKVFCGSIGGWDAHVASYDKHPTWTPHVRDPERRKARFQDDFPEFFDRVGPSTLPGFPVG